MIIENQKDVTAAVLSELQRAPDARFREIMSAFVRHLHDFVRETGLTEEEFRAATDYINAIGKHISYHTAAADATDRMVTAAAATSPQSAGPRGRIPEWIGA